MDIETAIEMLQEVARDDLEVCSKAINGGDKDTATQALERAFAKLDTAIDMLRSQSHG